VGEKKEVSSPTTLQQNWKRGVPHRAGRKEIQLLKNEKQPSQSKEGKIKRKGTGNEGGGTRQSPERGKSKAKQRGGEKREPKEREKI